MGIAGERHCGRSFPKRLRMPHFRITQPTVSARLDTEPPVGRFRARYAGLRYPCPSNRRWCRTSHSVDSFALSDNLVQRLGISQQGSMSTFRSTLACLVSAVL
jgi:hypothetical protein